jgi:hypothetical protein
VRQSLPDEVLVDADHRRSDEYDHHRWEDAQDEREDDLDRQLLGLLLGALPTLDSQLLGLHVQDLRDEIPKISACTIAMTKDLSSSTVVRSARSRSASPRPLPSRISCTTR